MNLLEYVEKRVYEEFSYKQDAVLAEVIDCMESGEGNPFTKEFCRRLMAEYEKHYQTEKRD